MFLQLYIGLKKNILECKFDAYISKALGFNPAKMIPARCTAIKKTKINPL